MAKEILRELIGIQKIHKLVSPSRCASCRKEDTDMAFLCLSYPICKKCQKKEIVIKGNEQYWRFK